MGARQFVVQEAAEDNLIFSRQGVFINAENDRFQVVARGSEMTTFFAPA